MAVTNKRGIFSLTDVRERQSAGVWAIKSDVFQTQASAFRVAPHPFGYFASGVNGPTPLSSIERIDFDNDTNTTLRSNLTTSPALTQPGPVGDASSGYLAGGYNPSSTPKETTTVERILYSNDTATASIRGPITQKRYAAGAAGNRNFGYIAGGAILPGPTRISTVDRIDYSNDTAQAPSKGPLGVPARILAGVGNNSYGYFGGGYPNISAVQRVDYSNDTVQSTQVSSFSPVKYHGIGAAGNVNYGWFAGGSPSSSQLTVVRLDYSNDTDTPTPKGNLNVPRFYIQGTGTQNYGYFGGGYPSISSIDRIDYNNDTVVATPKGNFAVVHSSYGAVSPLENAIAGLGAPVFKVDWQHGYAVGGSDRSVQLSNVDRVDYSNDLAVASVRGYLAAARGYGTSVSSRDFGYSTGGRGPAFPTITTDTQRISYASDTVTAVPAGNLSEPWRGGQTTDNINYGYLLGGMGPGTNHTLTNRIDFSNDTAAAVPKGNMDVDRYAGSGCGNEDYGFVGAGLINSHANNSSSISRIDYSSDTTQLSPKGPLTSEKRTTLSSGNANFGYWAGYSPALRVDKYSFANDTTVAVADLPNPQFYSGATGNASFGYYMAGYRVAPSMQTTVNRLDYSNDTTSMSVRGPLTFEKLGFKAVSAQSNAKTGTPLKVPASSPINYATNTVSYSTYGYFAGGYDIPPRRSSVERIDLSNDTANATQKANMSTIKQEQVGSSSLTHGYATGGYDGSNTTSSTFRIDFSNDTATPVTTGPFTRIITTTNSSHTGDYSWTAGGGSPNSVSTIDRYDFSNDTATSLSRGQLTIERQAQMSTGNLNYGYWAGGYFSSPITRHSNVDRIEYANDTAAATPKANLPEIRQQGSAIGNYDYGYWAGGYNGSSNQTSIYRFDYSNDSTQAAPRGNTIGAKTIMGGFNNRNYGYFGGGYDSSTAESTLVQRIDFANDTANLLPRGFLVETRAGASGHHSGNMVNPKPLLANVTTTTVATNFGYFGAGFVSSYLNTVDRIDYTNDTATASPRGNLSSGRSGLAATSNNHFGYFGGGYTPPNSQTSVIDRIEYSNDTITASAKGPLSFARRRLAATGNTSFGYFGGGQNDQLTPYSTVDRVDYSNDTATASPKGPLAGGRAYVVGTGNQNFGYIAGGLPSTSVISRVDYSSDTATPLSKGPLTYYIHTLAATGNADVGYFGGGSPSSYNSQVERLDYSNDSSGTVTKGNLSYAKRQSSATGNASFGYFGGGRDSSNPALSLVDRIDYSNDTATASPRGPLAGARGYTPGATSAASNANPQ